jgi:hypothetical protein
VASRRLCRVRVESSQRAGVGALIAVDLEGWNSVPVATSHPARQQTCPDNLANEKRPHLLQSVRGTAQLIACAAARLLKAPYAGDAKGQLSFCRRLSLRSAWARSGYAARRVSSSRVVVFNGDLPTGGDAAGSILPQAWHSSLRQRS